MKRVFKIHLNLLVCLLFLSSCREAPVVEEILRPVRFERVSLVGSGTEKSFSGTASAGTQSDLSFKVNGTLTKRLVKVGDRVTKGQLIAELDATDYVIEKKEMEASLAQATAQVRNSKASYERTRTLYENDSVAKSDLDTARAQFDSDKGALEALKQKLNLAKLKTEYTKLRAPIDGVVGEVSVEVNENINSGEAIVSIESEGDIKVVVGVPESFISSIKKGMNASVKFSSMGSQIFKAKVTEVSYSLVGTSTYPVSVVLDKSSLDVRPGMSANVTFKFTNGKKGKKNIIVAASSVAEDSKGKFVFVVTNEGQGVGIVQRRTVEIGDLTNQGFKLLNGIKDGDLVVTAGISKLTDGMRVKFDG